MKSQYGNRDTVGTTYIKAQCSCDPVLSVGDINSQMMPDFVDDLNEALQSNPFSGSPFYVNVAEKRDAQMPNAFRRKIIRSLYRPFPEFSTTVFHMRPKQQKVSYCWDLPHHTEMINVFWNPQLYDKKYVKMIMDWRDNELGSFGFSKISMRSGNIEGYEEKVIKDYQKSYLYFCQYIGMDEEAIETEKMYGFFWIPNKSFRDEVVNIPSPVVSLHSVA